MSQKQRYQPKSTLIQEDDQDEDLLDYHYSPPGAAPGFLVIDSNASHPEIELFDYKENQVIRLNNVTPEDCASYLDTDSVSWVDVSGLGNEEVLLRLGKVFDLHPLVLEEVVNVPQRPKVEEYANHLLIVTQMAIVKDNAQEGFWLEQVSFVLGKHYLLTVQEEPQRDCFKLVRDRLLGNRGNIRQKGSDYLFYTLWDAIIDNYFPVLEACEDRLDELEDEVLLKPTRETLGKIYDIKREFLALRRAIWPQRNALNLLIRDNYPQISEEVRVYLRDCYDNVVQIIELLEIYRELASGLMDVYLSAVSNKMNEIMKILTVISTIFIPLTFIAGVYGMNFDPETSPWNMPELKWYWGYPICLAVMLVTAGGLVFFFWKRGWFKNVSTAE